MNRRALVLFGEDLPAAALAQLDASGPSAALLIDVDAGCIIAANANGAALFWLDGVRRAVADADLSPPLLDASMPALVRLRALATTSDRDTSTEALVFWTRRGALQLPCRVDLLRAHLLGSGARTIATASSYRSHHTTAARLTRHFHLLPATMRRSSRKSRGASTRDRPQEGSQRIGPGHEPSRPPPGSQTVTRLRQIANSRRRFAPALRMNSKRRSAPSRRQRKS